VVAAAQQPDSCAPYYSPAGQLSAAHMSLYQLLGVPPSASGDEVRSAFRARAVAESRGGGGDTERFTQLQAAYEVLSDADRRAEYDLQQLEAPPQPEGLTARFRGGSLGAGGAGGSSATGRGGAQQAGGGGGATGDAFGGKGLMGQLEPSTQIVKHAAADGQAQLAETSYQLTHTEGFDAWLRNHRQAGQVLTGDDMVKKGMIPSTGSVDTVLPEMHTEAVVHSSWGEPTEVLRVHRRLGLPGAWRRAPRPPRSYCGPAHTDHTRRLTLACGRGRGCAVFLRRGGLHRRRRRGSLRPLRARRGAGARAGGTAERRGLRAGACFLFCPPPSPFPLPRFSPHAHAAAAPPLPPPPPIRGEPPPHPALSPRLPQQ
jgi:hypothetical protein